MAAEGNVENRLRRQVDGASVAVVRIALGLLVAAEAASYLGRGWIAPRFVEPAYHFTFQGFDWVQPWGGVGMYVHFAVLGILGLCLAAGFAHRPVAPLTVVAFAYVFLLDKAEYLNHFYAAILLLALVAAAPTDRALSIAAWRHPERSPTVPVWSVWMLRFQVGVIYVYAGVAKLTTDWVAGEPMSTWLAERSDLAVIGGLLEASWAGIAFSWSGLALDLAIVPLLLWRRTRALAFCLALGFHALNWVIFDIGIFPPMMIAATTIFFDPSWPRTAWTAIRLAGRHARGAGTARKPRPPVSLAPPHPDPLPARGRASRLLVPALALWIAFQLLVPLRHHLYPGSVHWTEEGHRFAWHMKLRDKQGRVTFTSVDRRSGERHRLDPLELITPRQHARASVRPDMILQLAHRLAERERDAGRDVEIHAEAMVSLNGRPARHLVDPERDLSALPRDPWAADWIEPGPPARG